MPSQTNMFRLLVEAVIYKLEGAGCLSAVQCGTTWQLCGDSLGSEARCLGTRHGDMPLAPGAAPPHLHAKAGGCQVAGADTEHSWQLVQQLQAHTGLQPQHTHNMQFICSQQAA